MIKFNQKGLDILDYKRQILNKEYPEIVKKSLIFTFDNYCASLDIDSDINLQVKDEDISVEEFEHNLLTRVGFAKSDAELIEEYSLYVDKLEMLLSDLEYNDRLSITPNLETDTIDVVLNFKLYESFIDDYFLISSTDKMSADEFKDKLINKLNFLQQFAVLRLPKILKDFILETYDEFCNEHMYLTTNKVYNVETEPNVYLIDLSMKISVNHLEEHDPEDDGVLKDELVSIIETSTDFFNSRIV